MPTLQNVSKGVASDGTTHDTKENAHIHERAGKRADATLFAGVPMAPQSVKRLAQARRKKYAVVITPKGKGRAK